MPVGKNLRKPIDGRVGRSLIRNARGRIERNQVHLGFDSRQQLCEPPRILWGVVDTLQHHVFERDAISLLQRETPACLENLGQRILSIRRD